MKTKFLAGILAMVFGLLMNPISAHADFYKWIDDNGDVHFTDQYANIPEKYRPFAETRQTPIESSPPTIIEKSASTLEKLTSEPTPETPEPVAQETSSVFRGVISNIDKAARTIVVAGPVETMVFPVTENTAIATDFGKQILFAELRAGMPVSVEHIVKDEVVQPLKIKINTPPRGTGKRQREAIEMEKQRGSKK